MNQETHNIITSLLVEKIIELKEKVHFCNDEIARRVHYAEENQKTHMAVVTRIKEERDLLQEKYDAKDLELTRVQAEDDEEKRYDTYTQLLKLIHDPSAEETIDTLRNMTLDEWQGLKYP